MYKRSLCTASFDYSADAAIDPHPILFVHSELNGHIIPMLDPRHAL